MPFPYQAAHTQTKQIITDSTIKIISSKQKQPSKTDISKKNPQISVCLSHSDFLLFPAVIRSSCRTAVSRITGGREEKKGKGGGKKGEMGTWKKGMNKAEKLAKGREQEKKGWSNTELEVVKEHAWMRWRKLKPIINPLQKWDWLRFWLFEVCWCFYGGGFYKNLCYGCVALWSLQWFSY